MHELNTLTETILRQSGQIGPPYCPRRLLSDLYPESLVTGGDLPLGVDEAVSVSADGPTLIYQRSLPPYVRRLAIAHGAAHVFLGDFQRRRRARCRPGESGERDLEQRADDFAAALLVPLRDLSSRFRAWHAVPLDVDRELARHTWLDRLDQLSELFAVNVSTILRRVGHLRSFQEKQTRLP